MAKNVKKITFIKLNIVKSVVVRITSILYSNKFCQWLLNSEKLLIVMTSKSPIALFVYNRLWHTQKTVEALQKNEIARDSELFIFCDGPKNINEKEKVKMVRDYITKISGFKDITIIQRENNLGLAKSIITGVTEIINKYGKIIVLEDDLVTSPYFLRYMNESLDFYEKIDKVYSITGYNLPPSSLKIPEQYKSDIFFNPRPMSWSWATWKDRWNKVDWDVSDYDNFLKNKKAQREFNKAGGNDLSDMLILQMNGDIDSWYIRWCYTHYKNNSLCVYPVKSMVINIGHDASGVHCGNDQTGLYTHSKLEEIDKIDFTPVTNVDKKIMSQFVKAFPSYNDSKRKKYIDPRFYLKIFKTIVGNPERVVIFLIRFFSKYYNLYAQHYQTEQVEKLKLRYPNSIISTNVSITPDCKLGNHTVINSNISLSNVIIGDYSYVNSSINNATIGKFCSIAQFCQIGIGKHPSKNFVSTFPAFYSKNNTGCKISFSNENVFDEFERIEIGNDVWIGTDSIILDGVKIGDGAIIGAGAVVTKDVDDYAIVGGVPAKLIRYRFSRDQVDFLKQIRWWDKDINWIKNHQESFRNIDEFTKYLKK